MSTVISVENLSKKYLLSHQAKRQSYVALRDVLAEKTNAIGRRLLHPFGSSKLTPQFSAEDFWALKDVSFEIKQGERVGIIGRNGAGKSTLLKILSRIVEPTSGRVRIKGRIASLLEVGTGFHPELTGRENIFLNGAILGMTRAEIRKKFDEIVDFAEIEKFLDTPVKRYSSGMYVRLAFAVAAHMEPEILLVDEVLAVGDAQFQKKCLGKMEDVSAKEGRTVLFVSHNMGVIRSLCPHCVWLNQGNIVKIADSNSIVEQYLRGQISSLVSVKCRFEEDFTKEFQVLQAKLKNLNNELCRDFDCDHPVIIELECVLNRKIPGLYGYLSIDKLDGEVVMVSDSNDHILEALGDLQLGRHLIEIIIPPRTLAPGEYSVYLNFTSRAGLKGFQIDSPGRLFTFNLADHSTRRGNTRGGYFSTSLEWRVQQS
ncbi:MAG: ABC transporter ATP-binding protein [Desulfobulbus sp.]|nr:ABC transporter ATP-binding protein [Desulfobulbus sp.]